MNVTLSAPSAPSLRSDLRLAALLGVAAALATAALFPYLQLLMPEALAKVPVPLPLLVLLQSAQALLLLGLLAFCGLRMGHAVGLGAPWLQAWLAKTPRKSQPWWLAAACGAAAALVVLGLDPLFASSMPAPLQALPAQPAGTHALAGFLASFYGGIAEEIQLRLFLVTLLAWGMSRVSRARVADWQLLLAVLVAAIAFGAGHLPAAAKVWPLDSVVVARTLLLNGIAGLVFGWFYIRHGLESAMLSHFCADLVLHVAAPLALG
jgi:membrane protease YdiL (CAAX protease family)